MTTKWSGVAPLFVTSSICPCVSTILSKHTESMLHSPRQRNTPPMHFKTVAWTLHSLHETDCYRYFHLCLLTLTPAEKIQTAISLSGFSPGSSMTVVPMHRLAESADAKQSLSPKFLPHPMRWLTIPARNLQTRFGATVPGTVTQRQTKPRQRPL